MAKIRKVPKAPTIEDEHLLTDVVYSDGKEDIFIRNKKFSFGWISGHASNKLNKIINSQSNESVITCKCVAAARLNGFFKIKLFYWFLWRWYYYIRQYGQEELSDAVAMIKKKVPLTAYLANTTLLIGMRQTIMQMNRQEVYRTLQELSMDKNGNSAKTDRG